MDEAADQNGDVEAVVFCEFRSGTLSVHEDHVVIERAKRSMFEDTTIPMEEIEDVDYSRGFLTGHIQIKRTGVDADSGGILSHPIDENTLHLARTDRSCAERARDAILARAAGW